MRKHKRFTLILCLSLLLTASAIAAVATRAPLRILSRPDVRLSLAAAVQRDDKFVAVGNEVLKSGDVLNWTLTSTNVGDGDARSYRATGHVPAGMSFVANSATAPETPKIMYSIDRGQTFQPIPTVKVRQPDGTTKDVPAPVSAYTEVRYEWPNPLQAGHTFVASYKVRVN